MGRCGVGDALRDFWDDLLADGALDEHVTTADTPMASLRVETAFLDQVSSLEIFLKNFPLAFPFAPGILAGSK